MRFPKRVIAALVTVFAIAAPTSSVARAQDGTPEKPSEAVAETTTPNLADDLSPAATERRVQELRRHVKEDLARKNWERARQNLAELVTRNQYQPDYHVSLGIVFRELGNLPDARRKYRDYLDYGGNPALGALLLAETFAQDGQNELAFEQLERAAEAGMNVMRAAQQFPALLPYTTDTRFIRLALRLENYEVANLARRDPFVPRDIGNELSVDPKDPNGPTSPRDAQEAKLAEARVALKRIEFALRSQDEGEAMSAYKALQEVVVYEQFITEPDLAAEFRGILDRLGEIEELLLDLRLTYLYDTARTEIENMEQAFRNRDFPKVDQIHTKVDKIVRDMEKTSSEFSEVSDQVRSVADQWVTRARTWREFNLLELRIEGIIISEEDSFSIMNGRTYRVGGWVGDLQVIQIEPNQVWFAFRGERIPLVFRRY